MEKFMELVLFLRDRLILWRVKLIEVSDTHKKLLNGFHSNSQENQKHFQRKSSHHVTREKQVSLMQNGKAVKTQIQLVWICQQFQESKMIKT